MRVPSCIRVLCAAAVLGIPLAPRAAHAQDIPVTHVPTDGAPIAVRSWLVAGLFPSPDLPDPDPRGPERAGFDADYLESIGGETGARPRPGTTVTAPDGEVVTFVPYESKGTYADINEVLQSPGNVCAYLYAELESDAEQVAYLHVGTNAAGKAWVGQLPVISHPYDRVAMRSQNVARVALPRGRTRLLLKVDHDGGGWGAFAELYGRTAHRAFVAEKFPRHLTVEADDYLPDVGDTATLRIANWLPPDAPVPVVWTLVDGGERELDERSPVAKFAVREGPDRVIRVRAQAAHPRGGIVAGECILLAGGEEAGRRTIRAFDAMRGDPWRLTGARRDAYALALYAIERARRDARSDDLTAAVRRIGEPLARLHLALDHLAAGTDPFADRTGMFEAAYLSKADDTAQPFTLAVPYRYPGNAPYALFVNLHGASFTHELPADWAPSVADSSYQEGTILASVMGRGRYSGYAGLGEDDVLQVVRWVTSHYAVDPDRVYVRGGSMGGFGTWKIASLYPDMFAAAWIDCGGPPLLTLANYLNLPAYVNHGDADRSVPVSYARVGVRAMEALGCPVVYTEYPGVDHAVGVAVGPEGYMTRLSAHERVSEPSRIRIVAAHPRYAQMYWGRIEQWDDPHRPASLEAAILAGNVVSVSVSNVAQARLSPPPKHLAASRDIVWLVGGRRLSTPQSSDGAYDVILGDGLPTVRAHVEKSAPRLRSYVQGSTMNLYRGEPLLIVYGTRSPDTTLRRAIRTLAEEASRWLAPESVMEFGSVPMIADTEMTDEHYRSRNLLLLLGGPDDNAATRHLMPHMSIREEQGSLRIFTKERVPRLAEAMSLDGRGYAIFHQNLGQPRFGLLVVYASSVPQFYTIRRGRLLSRAMVETDPFGPDLVVENVARADSAADPRRNQLVRQLWFTHGWQPEELPDEVITRRPANAHEEAEMTAQVYRRVAEAQFAVVERAHAAEPCSYDTATFTWRDRPYASRQIAVSQATGRELLELGRSVDDQWWMFSPVPDSATIDPKGTYRLAGPLDLVISAFASHRMTPQSVDPVSDGALVEAVAREVWGVRSQPRN